MWNDGRLDKVYTIKIFMLVGKANASNGKIFVTIPQDHFGPILAKHDATSTTYYSSIVISFRILDVFHLFEMYVG
jgi:hypothetical protein